MLEDLRPLLAPARPGAAPAHRRSSTSSALYKRELTVVLRQHRRGHAGARPAHARCTTCARRTRSTSENLAVYPRRLGTNRPNPYLLPGGYDKLAQGLDSYETRHCGRALPTVSSAPLPPAAPPARRPAAVHPGHPAAPGAHADPDADRPGQAFTLPQTLIDSITSSCSRAGSGRGGGAGVPPAGSAGRRQHPVSAREGLP